ncbi:MAG TPA: hypothetical protein VMF58_08005 [Rhizomicrobium sp.]|nr:hypothetical protein [Rhizomicrobium sp.]
MKSVLVLAMALGLYGCGSTDFFGDSGGDSSATPVAQAPADQTASASPASMPAPSQQSAAAPMESADTGAAPMAQDASVPAAAASASSSAHCTTLAKQRAVDAAYEGEDPDTQEAVHDRTYADCIAWDLKHAYSR